MKKLHFVVILSLVFTLALSGCGLIPVISFGVVGSGNLSTETRALKSFDRVVLTGSGDVVLIKGDKEEVKIEADDNILPLITTEVKNGDLVIGIKPNQVVRSYKAMRFEVTYKDISALDLVGSGSIIADAVASASFEANITGSGDIHLTNLQTTSFESNLTGSGEITLSGKTDKLDLSLPGSGNFNGFDLETRECRVSILGSGRVQVNVSENLAASITGSGDIEYKGAPAEVDKHVTGSGSIKARN
ncbi:MAG TPA: head GIN domain-containing protein [Anaerolineaceae bacterium]|nr:head GIN domain-containing protein [Anaerolineaceae bacterium]HPN54268.1 head GIN domain-containing protein [Anaerolineaceae bacterium]